MQEISCGRMPWKYICSETEAAPSNVISVGFCDLRKVSHRLKLRRSDAEEDLIISGEGIPNLPRWGSGKVNEFWTANDFEILGACYRREVENFLAYLAEYHNFAKSKEFENRINALSSPMCRKGKLLLIRGLYLPWVILYGIHVESMEYIKNSIWNPWNECWLRPQPISSSMDIMDSIWNEDGMINSTWIPLDSMEQIVFHGNSAGMPEKQPYLITKNIGTIRS